MITGQTLRDAILSGANNIANQRTRVDELNVFPVPDGDTGTNMSMTIGAARAELEAMPDSCTLETPRDMYLGFYYAPGVVCEAIKTAIYAQCMLELLGKNPVPRYCDDHNDIVTCFDAGTADALIGFCQGIQAASPVDSYAAPEPSPEPGYTDEVVMASGSFTQGSTIELSCDGPLREPYTCYLQGGLNFAASRAGVLLAIQKAYFKD